MREIEETEYWGPVQGIDPEIRYVIPKADTRDELSQQIRFLEDEYNKRLHGPGSMDPKRGSGAV